MSWWNNTLLSAGTGWNFRSVCLLLGHIQPVAIENAACRAALCCGEIALPLAPGLGLVPFYLYKSSRLHKHQQTIVSSLTVAVVDVSCCRLLIGQSGKDPRTEHSTRIHQSLAEMVRTLSKGAEIRKHKEAETFCRHSASKIRPASSHPLVKLSSNLPEKSKKKKKIFQTIAAISASPKRLSPTNTDMQPHFLLKRRKKKACCYPGALQRDIAANKQSYSQPPVSSSRTHLILCLTTERQPEKWEEYGPADSIKELLGRNLNKVLK